MEQTTLSTITLLEARLLRIEQVLHGRTNSQASTPSTSSADSAVQRMRDLEHRFSSLLNNSRVYAELIKSYRSNPDLFHAPEPSQVPTQLTPDALKAIVLSSASSYTAVQSSLTAIKDTPTPEPAKSATLLSLSDKMKSLEAVQLSQAAQLADLRKRSDKVIRYWYENGVLPTSRQLSNLESRIETVEKGVRRRERAKELDQKP